MAYPVSAYVYEPLPVLEVRLPSLSYVYTWLNGVELAAVVDAVVSRYRSSYPNTVVWMVSVSEASCKSVIFPTAS